MISIKTYFITKEWFLNGKRHRIDGPAIEWKNGNKSWWINGVVHRIDGPAIEKYGYKIWMINGKRHRINGPAVEGDNGDNEWWINGKQYTVQEYEQILYKIKHSLVNIIYNIKLAKSCKMSLYKFLRLIKLIKKKEFIEWWYHPSNPGGLITKKKMRSMFN